MTRLVLPWPPSLNTYWRHIPMGRSVRSLISRKGRAYREAVAATVRGTRTTPGRLSVVLAVYPPDRRRRDLDNIPKALLDSLQHAGVIEDDENIDDLRIIRCDVVRGGRVVVEIETINAA
jgi:crossover junction endodeoxyribonuclease RusA